MTTALALTSPFTHDRHHDHDRYLENAFDLTALLDRHGAIVRMNWAAADILGYPPALLAGRRCHELVRPQDRDRLDALCAAVCAGQVCRDHELHWLRGDGREICLAVSARWLPAEALMIVSARDVTEHRRARDELKRSRERLDAMLESIGDAFYAVDRDWRITYANRKAAASVGLDVDAVIGRHVLEVEPEIARSEALAHYQRALETGQPTHAEIWWRPSASWLEIRAYPNADGLSVYFHDITARKLAESRLQQLATHDTLTGLPNRSLLHDRLQRMLDACPRGEAVAVLFLDLDRFKEVNDSFGHELGDMLLCEVAARLRRVLRPDDVVARLGGDEFVVAAPCPTGLAAARRIASKLLDVLTAPVRVGAQEVIVGASIGISLFPDDAATRELLFQSADTAMYRAKADGRNRYRFFEPAMTQAAKARMALEMALRPALARGEFELHYQPRVDLGSMTVTGMEALLRWRHPELGNVPPAQFIAIAEETGLIVDIGRWVLREACRATRHLADELGRAIRVSVNVSARQLAQAGFVDEVRGVLAETGLPARCLELELTESALIEDMERTAGMLRELRQLGVMIAVDDFGTGYSGLAYLRRFPIDVLKLDRSFVLEDDGAVGAFDFIKAFVDMAHALRLSVVAEGVETADVLDLLRAAACDEAQGYLLARPMPLPALRASLSGGALSRIA